MFIESVLWNQWNIQVGAFYKKSERLVAENNCCEKLHLRCFKSIGLTQNTSSLFGKSFCHRTIKLRRIKILKTSCRKLSILSKFWLNDAHGQGWWAGGELVWVIMTHCVRKSICDYWLKNIDPDICSILIFFRKGSRNSFSTTFFVWFFKKNVSHVI